MWQQKNRQRYFNNNRQTSNFTEITGIFHVPYTTKNENQDDVDSESDDEENDPWLDFEEMGESDSSVRSRVPKEKTVHIKDDHGKIHNCIGRFSLTQIFWKVTVKVSKDWLKSAPVYAIRTDANVEKQNLVMIFLTDCLKANLMSDKAPAVIACFETFCRGTNCSSTLNFTNLEDTLKKYINYEHKQGCCLKQQVGIYGQLQQEDHSLHLQHVMHISDLCTVVLRAASHPTLVKTISSLLPYTFAQFLHMVGKNRDRERAIQLANEMADQTPWEFVFRNIIYAKLNVCGIEATLLAYQNAGYFSITPQREKDAIYIYETLKTDASMDGHTYVNFKRLQNSYHLKKLHYQISSEKRWEKALEYLEINKVIKIESFNCDKNIFLYYNWQAEVDIECGFKEILQKHQKEALRWTIDCRSSDFERVSSDPDQLRALHLIASSPITVLSGKGGCGKTTVITTLLKHICDRMEEDIIETRCKEQAEETNKKTDNGKTLSYDFECKDDDLTTYKNVDAQAQGPLKQSGVSDITSTCQNPKADNSHCHVDRAIVLSKDHNKSHNNSSAFSADFNLSEDTLALKTCVPAPASRHLPILDVSTSLDSSGHNPSGSFQISKRDRKWPQSKTPEISKEERLRGEVISDLLKMLKVAKDVDDPLLQEYKKQFLLTAPTGKAAKLLGSKSKLYSATLHSVIMSWRMYCSKTEGVSWNYSTVEVLVVDECSLLSARLFACVLNILLRHANLKKIVLLGDMRQLPSIEAGNFLTDVFTAFGSEHVCSSLELTSNHRSESSLIIENAGKISCQVMPTFNKEQKFHLLQLSGEADDNERDEAIRHILNHAKDLGSQVDSQFISFRNADCVAVNELCCHHYNQHSIKTAAAGSRKGHADFRRGDKICLGKNAMVPNCFNLMLNKYLERDTDLQEAVSQVRLRKRNGVQAGINAGSLNRTMLNPTQALSLFESDDAVFDHTLNEMVTRDCQVEKLKAERANQQRTAAVQETVKTSSLKTTRCLFGEENEKLCNGEIFFIMDVIEEIVTNNGRPERYLVLSDKDPYFPRVVCVNLKFLTKLCKMRHSWARTIHTFQGSECDSVVYLLGKAIPQNWQHVYTAVTRGKKSVYVIGSWEELHKAISRQAYPRRSRLRHRLEEMIMMYKRTLLPNFSKDIRNMSTFQDVADAGSYHQDLEEFFQDDQFTDTLVKMKTEDSGCMDVLQGNAPSFSNDLDQETYQHRDNLDDFNVFTSIENNEEINSSDEELAIQTNNTDFTSLRGAEAHSSSLVNWSTENIISGNFMTDRINASSPVKLTAKQISVSSPDKTVLSSLPPTLPVIDSKSLFTPDKWRGTESALNTPFRDTFKRSLTLEEKSSSNGENLVSDRSVKKKFNF